MAAERSTVMKTELDGRNDVGRRHGNHLACVLVSHRMEVVESDKVPGLKHEGWAETRRVG